MPVPASLDRVVLRARYDTFGGQPVQGWVKFLPSIKRLVIPGSKSIVLPQQIVGYVYEGQLLDEQRQPLTLFATDDPDGATKGWQYTVTEQFNGVENQASYKISVPVALKNLGIDLADVSPETPTFTENTSFVTLPTFAALKAQVDAAGLGTVPDGAVTTAKMADASVARRSIIAGSVDKPQLSAAVQQVIDGAVALGPDNKLPRALLPDGIGGTPAADSITPALLTPALRTQIASGGVADGGVVEAKIAPRAVSLPKLDPVVAGRVEVPRFLPQDQTTALGLPAIYARADTPEIPASAVGLPSIYDPYLVRVPDAVYAAFPQYGKWRLYTSTDHDSSAGGIACLRTDSDRPGDPGVVWTSIRPGGTAIIFKKGGGDQIETPCVVYNPATALFHMYYQTQLAKVGTITPQYTEVATSANGITGWTVVPGGGIPNPRQGWLGWRHTGYMNAWLVDGQWVAWSLSSGGTNASSLGWSYSADGFTWLLDRQRMITGASWGGGTGKIGFSSLFKFRGALWGAGRVRSSGAAGAATTTAIIWMAPMRPDLRGPAGRLQAIPIVQDPALSTPPDGLGLSVAASADGSLWSAYRTGDKNSSFRFLEVK